MRFIRLGFFSLCDKHSRAVVLCAALFACFPIRALCVTHASIHHPTQYVPGIAWDVSGTWRLEGSRERVLTGDAIEPGALLQPGEGGSSHSITILLPDGQRILYECFSAKDCARGFRVPELYRDPSQFAAGVITRIRAVLVRQRSHSLINFAVHSRAGRDEAVAVLGPGNRIEVSGLAGSLSDGQYSYDLNPIQSAYPPQTGVHVQKSGHSIALRLPGPGLFRLKIADALRNPRIDYLIAAVRPDDGDKIVNNFQKTHALFEDWNANYMGWPIHDFQRAYLEALMLGVRPDANSARNTSASVGRESGLTREPAFSPKPGVFDGDTAVTLKCATPGAVIHYTVDNSQPFNSSPVYRAPIMVKGTELTIKAFAESPRKKDSAVVTGIFRIASP